MLHPSCRLTLDHNKTLSSEGRWEEETNCTEGPFRCDLPLEQSWFLFPSQSGSRRQGRGRVRHNGQAWKEIKRGEAALQTLPQLKLGLWALWSLYQIGRANSHPVIWSCPKLANFTRDALKKGHWGILKLRVHWRPVWHHILLTLLDHVLFSPSPLVQLAETPEEVVVSKD